MEQVTIDRYNTNGIVNNHPDWEPDPITLPVPNIYTTKTVDVRNVAADRVSFSTHFVPDSGVPVRIVNRLENGVASRVTLTVAQRNTGTEGFVYVFASDEHVSSPLSATVPPTLGALLGSTDKASNIPGVLTLTVCGEIFVACTPNGGAGAFVYVAVENFHGTDGDNR